MADKVCINCFVSGKVQGVWFRASTQKEAQRLGLTGWVRNLPDGRVEVMASGAQERVQELKRWLEHGPELAEVSKLEVVEVESEEFTVFEII